MIETIKKSFFAGIIVIIPIGLTVYVLRAVFDMSLAVGGKIAEPLKRIVDDAFPGFDLLASISGLLLVILTLIIIGFLARNVAGRRVVQWIDNLFKRIPLISMVYTTTKQIIESFSGGRENSFSKVVFVEYPRKGVWTLGFVTKETKNDNNQKFYNLFVPTTPNPTSGFFLIIPIDDVKETDINVEEGFQMIVSSGMVSGDKTPF
ncbi:MAG: DUF502 domain-containing protein [Candidatus Neomarinimicrobiota bacterium]|nr:DUF502 domain-containing protein [Candidatus Neomarinimicrobiota bacterium]MEE3241664.1 DUF502 domain-containing protein [Candidatus Neomarinimicrobiota bacterium]MEE3301876.1 DUF502 domain-containing protein [Candidatus Neomarinimicrobiota bacterium]